MDNISVVIDLYLLHICPVASYTVCLPLPFPSREAAQWEGGRIQLGFICDVLVHSFLPATSLLVLGIAANLLTIKLIVSNIVAEDFVMYAKAGGLKNQK